MTPAYDCGDPECDECRSAFGPDRSRAIANHMRREQYYAQLERENRERDVVESALAMAALRALRGSERE